MRQDGGLLVVGGRNRDPNAHWNANLHADLHADRYAAQYRNFYPYRNSYPHADCNTICLPKRYANLHANLHADRYGNSDSDRN